MAKNDFLSKTDIVMYLEMINEELAKIGQRGEIDICGGAAMVLAYNSRDATQDIDAVYKPKDEITKIIANISTEHGLNSHWLNDDVSMFTSELNDITSTAYITFSNLVVNLVDEIYLLTMKIMAAREDSNDLQDAVVLIKQLGVNYPPPIEAGACSQNSKLID